MKKYFPVEPAPNPAKPDKDDLDYAECFRLVAHTLDMITGSSEDVALRLSTCRNLFLTVNGLFVDLQKVLGSGSVPSLLSRAIYFARKGKYKESRQAIGDIRMVLGIYDAKRSVWARRAELDHTFRDAVAKLGDPLAATRITRLLENSRTSQHGDLAQPDSWEARWLELSCEENEWAADKLRHLDEARDVVHAFSQILPALSEWLQASHSLFSATSCDHWGPVFDLIMSHAGPLSIVSTRDEEEPSLAFAVDGHGIVRLPRKASEAAEIDAVLPNLWRYFGQREEVLYKRLCSLFKPNVEQTPLPEPYRIDMREACSVKVPDGMPQETVRCEPKPSFGRSSPEVITVAVCEFGIPLAYYNTITGRYVDNEHRQEVVEIARAAIDVAAANGANVLVLPELFLPYSTYHDVADKSRERQIALIAGVEPTDGGDQGWINQGVIILPHQPENLFQHKRRNSPYEQRFFFKQASIDVFSGTEIGSFAVVICSDYREADILGAIANAGVLIDTLFVCSYNPHPELFATLAVSDAVRLYCHVVIANGKPMPDPNTGAAEGTLVCSPKVKDIERLLAPKKSVALGRTAIGGCTPSLAFYALPLAELGHTREKPHTGYLNCPHFRRGALHS